MRRRFLLLLVTLAALVAWPRTVAADGPPPFVVIVNAKNPYSTLDRDFVSDAFLKKTTRWPSGEVIKPIDLPSSSPVREHFSNAVLKRSVAAVKSYWEQMIFSGRDVPPAEVPTDDDVLKYVTTHSGAIGYVSGSASLADVQAVRIRQ